MHLALIIYGSLNTLSGGYLYDRKLVEFLHSQGDTVEIISLPWRNYAAHLTDNLTFRLPAHVDLIIQDELNHPSLLTANHRPRSCPVVSLVHHLRSSEQRPTWINQFYRLIEKHYLQSVDGFIFNSHTTRRVVEQLVGSSRPYVVAYPPTDRFGVGINEAEIASRAQQGELQILFVGNVIRRKGLHTLLEALRHIPTAARLDVVGSLTFEPRYAQQMRRRAEALSIPVFFHGALDAASLEERFRQAHVLVVPSGYEGFGIVYLEAMGFGLPAIGTTAGAAPEVITDGQTGFLIPPNEAAALAQHLTRLALDRSLLTQMGLQALEHYRRQPSWEQTAAAVRSFLFELVQNGI
jgi:glycosyltransferase involved in cell wall biosynthesis